MFFTLLVLKKQATFYFVQRDWLLNGLKNHGPTLLSKQAGRLKTMTIYAAAWWSLIREGGEGRKGERKNG
jgi:hypothetical protein